MNAPTIDRRPTAREKREQHLSEAARRENEIAHHRRRVADIKGRLQRSLARGRDAGHRKNLAQAERTLAKKVAAHRKALADAGKLERAAHRADAALKGIKPPALPPGPATLSKAEQRAAEKAKERGEREIADRRRLMRSVGLDDDLRLASGARDIEILDTTRIDPKRGVRHGRSQPHDRLFQHRAKQWTPERELAIKQVDGLWHAAAEEEGIAPPSMMQKVDRSTGPAGAPRGAAASMAIRDIRAAIGARGIDLLVRRIVRGETWDRIAAARHETVRRAGTAFVDALDIVIRVLGIAPPADRPDIRVERDDGSTDVRKRRVA